VKSANVQLLAETLRIARELDYVLRYGPPGDLDTAILAIEQAAAHAQWVPFVRDGECHWRKRSAEAARSQAAAR
jgi:hypothetical protein